jgi:hypothetical protein
MDGKFWFKALLTGLLLTTLVMAGCEGDDGDDGAQGIQGEQGVAGEPGEPGSATTAGESCNICHGEESLIGLSIDERHPILEEPVVSNVVVTRAADNTLTVTFNVATSDGPLAGLGAAPSAAGDLRVYLADIVPANTPTGNLPQSSWPTPFPELYAETRGSDAIVTLTNNLDGTYTYVIAPSVLATDFGLYAPEGDLATHQQRIYIRADARDFAGLNRAAFVADFLMPAADGSSTAALGNEETTRTIIVAEACSACHNDPLQRAAHGGGYQSPQVCVMCHSPIGQFPENVGTNAVPVFEPLGDVMQDLAAWSGNLYHKIHAAIDMDAFPDRIDIDENGDGEITADEEFGYSKVTYPQDIRECQVCHLDAGQDLANYWNTNPSIEACTTCHTSITFDGAATHSGGAQVNANCVLCHPAAGAGVGQSVTNAHVVTYDAETQAYNVTISLSPDANADGVYEVGETILVTATTDLAGFPYTSTDTAFLRGANLYVYGPRALALPVLTPGSTTDPDYMDPLVTAPGTPPDQGRSMLASAQADDANNLTDASGFKYQLLEITEDMAAGTYMIQTNIDFSVIGDRTTDGRHRGPRFYPLDGWQLETFQVGTATEELKVAGECSSCHDQRNFSTMAHRSYFGTDGCLACHDQSGNHADPLTNRVHAVHAASITGDLVNRDWREITFPQSLNSACNACHNSGDNDYRAEPKGSWGFACIGCHADFTDGIFDHMLTNGAPFPTEE